MSIPTRNRGLVFYPSISLVNEDHDKEYLLTKFKQFSQFDFEEIPSERLTRRKHASNQTSTYVSKSAFPLIDKNKTS